MNSRQKFAKWLSGLSDEELKQQRAEIEREYRQAVREGQCSLEAFLYFDLAQADEEIAQRRKVA